MDWTIVGGGLTGASLAYELAKRHQSVVLLEPDHPLQGATRWSYGGVAYWSGITPFTQTLCQESHDRYHALLTELELDPQYRETHLLIPIAIDQDLEVIYQAYQCFTPKPELLTPKEAQSLEPLLNSAPLQGVLRFPHGHVNPLALTQAYRHALLELGGTIVPQRAIRWRTEQDRIIAIETDQEALKSDRVILCAGAGGRSLLAALGLRIPLYFSQAEVIETVPTDLRLNGVILPANQSRLRLEAQLTDPALVAAWTQGQPLNLPPVLEPGAVQFPDLSGTGGRCALGQISRLTTAADAPVDPVASETQIRETIAHLLPDLAALPGTWQCCNVSFSADGLPLVGTLLPWENLFLFSGFTSPFALVPALSVRFAEYLLGRSDLELEAFRPDRDRGMEN
jgi:glycine/D-amino acid oxidase-like deaminating enzyme